MKRLLAVAGVVLALLLLSDPGFAQCAMCKTALTGSPEGRSIGAQFNRAILVMMIAPYLIFTCIATVLFRERIARSLGTLRRRIQVSFPRPWATRIPQV